MDLGVAFQEYQPERFKFIADRVLPKYGVAKESATLSVLQRENTNIPETKHANGAAYNRVDLYLEDMDYTCVDHGLEAQLTDRDREKFRDDFDAEVEKIKSIKLKMSLAREKRVKDLTFNTTTWTGASLYTDNSGSPWDTVTTNIIGQVAAAKEKVRLGAGVIADSLIVGEAAFQNMLQNTGIIGRFPGATLVTQAMIEAAMSAIFGLEQLIVGGSVYNSADEGQTYSATDMWGDDYAMVALLGREGLPITEPQLGRTILWERYTPDLVYADEYREEQTKSDVYRVEESIDEKVIEAVFGHLIKIDA
jgi:hypothetical protein